MATYTCTGLCEIDAANVSQTKGASADVGKWSSNYNNFFMNFAAWNGVIPQGSIITGATLNLAKISGGFSLAQSLRLRLVTGAFSNFAWNSQPSVAATSGNLKSVSGTGAASVAWNIADLMQWIADNQSGYHIFKIERETNTNSGSSDAKSFNKTAANHNLVVTWNPPTAPSAPTSPSLTPAVFGTSVRCQWGAGGAGYNNAVTNYYLKFYANGVLQWESYVGNTTYKDFDTSGWAEGTQASFEVWTIGTFAPNWSGAVSAGGAYKNTKPYAPTNASVPKTSFIPSETIRVSFTNNGDPNSNTAGFEVAMQNGSSQWYNSAQIVGTNASGSATYVDVGTTGWTQGNQWKFFVRAYDAFGVRGDWSNATALVTMNTAPLDPTIGYPAAGSTVYNRTPRILFTAAQINDGTKHIAQVYAARGIWLSTATDFSPSTLFSTGINDNLAGLRKLVFKSDMVTDFPLGSNTIKSRMYDSFLYSGEISRQFNVATLAFTDANLAVVNMKVRAVHITELQTAIGVLRAAYGLVAVAWKSVTPNVTKIGDDSIITQMQTAVQDILTFINGWDAANATFDLSIAWVTVTVAGGVSAIKLRQAIEQLRAVLPTI